MQELYQLQNNQEDLITCGGDSEFLKKSLETNKKNIIYAPNLVMEGMIIHHMSVNKLA